MNLYVMALTAQASHTLSTRAKASGSLIYVAWTSGLSHVTWIATQGYAVWRIGESMTHGGDWAAIVAWYVLWATLGNVLAVWIAKRWLERK